MEEYSRYCEEHDQNALPGEAETVAAFLMTMTTRNIKTSTIRRKNSSISAVHRLSNLTDPTKNSEVKLPSENSTGSWVIVLIRHTPSLFPFSNN